MALYKRIMGGSAAQSDVTTLFGRFGVQFASDARWLKTRIEMYLARHGRQWRWTEEYRARQKNLQVLTYNVISNLIEQKMSLIANIDAPAMFEVSSESSGESDVNKKAMHFLNYSYAKSGGARLFERSVDMACSVGQDMQYFEPVFNTRTNEFYIRFSRIPFYRYHVLGNPRDEMFSDAGGLLVVEDITVSEISRRLGLSKDEEHQLYDNRFTWEDFRGAGGFQSVYNSDARELFTLFGSESFKEFFYNDGVSTGVAALMAKDGQAARDTATVRVVTHIFRDEPTTVYKVMRTGNVEAIVNARSIEEALSLKKPNWNYLQKNYFKEELEQTRKLPNGDKFTIGEFIDDDEKNGFALKIEQRLCPVVVRKYYGKTLIEEFRYATEEYPFTPIHRIWQDDKYSIGDVDSVYDLQRVYNESMTLIKGVQEEMRLGDRYIFSDEIQFSIEGSLGDPQKQQEALEELMTGDRRALLATFPRDNQQPFIRIVSQPVADEFIRYVYDMPSQITARMGLQPYILGEGGMPRTKTDAINRTNFGTSQIKNTAYAMYRAVAEHGRKALVYAQLESKLNLEIETGDAREKYNEVRFDENLGKFVIVNELRFDGSPLRVSFKGSEYHKNYQTKQTILDVLRYLPQGSPVTMMLAELLIRLEEVPELTEVLDRSQSVMQLQTQLEELQTQLQTISKELISVKKENADLKVQKDIQKRIAMNRERINRELNKLVSEIRAMAMRVQLNADKEVAVQMERVRAKAEAILEKVESDSAVFDSTQPTADTEQLSSPKQPSLDQPAQPAQPMQSEMLPSVSELTAPTVEEGEEEIPEPPNLGSENTEL